MKRSTQLPTRGSPEVLADALMLRIFKEEFPPGSALPPERKLAEEMSVDRTTLRMALKQLQRMNLISVRHGSGMKVNDYRLSGGLDVLAAMCSLPDLPLEGSFIVEALDFWLEIVSMTAGKAVVRMSLAEMRSIERDITGAIEAGDDLDLLVSSLLAVHDELARLSGSVVFQMLHNSTRALQERIIRLLPGVADLTGSLRDIKQMLRGVAVARPTEETVRGAMLAALRALTAKLREQLLFASAHVPR